MSKNSPERELLSELEELARRRHHNQLGYFRPYEQQKHFFDAGRDHRQRMFSAGNQLGKSTAGAAEVAFHATGRYPDWWAGKRFSHRVHVWVASNTSESTRDNAQRLLLGLPGQFGTGMLPAETILEVKSARGLPDAVDTVSVRHASGDRSLIQFKSYEKGRGKLQGASLHFVWCDEEPPPDIYSELVARLTATHGALIVTMTPLLGMSEVVMKFFEERDLDRHLTLMGIEAAEHIALAERETIIASYAAYEREARTQGIPVSRLGADLPGGRRNLRGRVFCHSTALGTHLRH